MAELAHVGVNPPVPQFLRLVTWVECGVVFAAAAVLFFAPALGRDIWAWSAAPFNARYIGAIYFAALLPLVVFAWSGRWSPGRVVLWMIFTFTTTIMLAMWVHLDRFEWSRPATWAFWFLYLFLPVNSAAFMVRLRGLPVAHGGRIAAAQDTMVLVIAAALALYGAALLLVPQAATSFWPWPVDAFHGRIYAATFITPAVGAALIRREGSASEYRCVGATLMTLGVLSIVAIAWTSAVVAPERKVDYARLGTWAFIALNVLTVVAGAWLAGVRPGRPAASAASVPPASTTAVVPGAR